MQSKQGDGHGVFVGKVRFRKGEKPPKRQAERKQRKDSEAGGDTGPATRGAVPNICSEFQNQLHMEIG